MGPNSENRPRLAADELELAVVVQLAMGSDPRTVPDAVDALPGRREETMERDRARAHAAEVEREREWERRQCLVAVDTADHRARGVEGEKALAGARRGRRDRRRLSLSVQRPRTEPSLEVVGEDEDARLVGWGALGLLGAVVVQIGLRIRRARRNVGREGEPDAAVAAVPAAALAVVDPAIELRPSGCGRLVAGDAEVLAIGANLGRGDHRGGIGDEVHRRTHRRLHRAGGDADRPSAPVAGKPFRHGVGSVGAIRVGKGVPCRAVRSPVGPVFRRDGRALDAAGDERHDEPCRTQGFHVIEGTRTSRSGEMAPSSSLAQSSSAASDGFFSRRTFQTKPSRA